MMTFEEAQVQFRELQARMARGEPLSSVEFVQKVAELSVVDENGVTWEIYPHTGQWMYYDGTDWIQSSPPTVSTSTVSPVGLAGVALTNRTTRRRAFRPIPVGRRDREWMPLAVGIVVLFFCAILLLFGGRAVLGTGSLPPPTAMNAKAGVLTHASEPTSVPTVTGLPTLPPRTATVAPVIAVVIERRVNVRAGPSTQAEVVGKILKDDILMLVGRNADMTWYQVEIVGATQPRWVFAETLTISSGESASLPIVQP